MTADDETRRDSWSREQDRAFENALWEYPEETLDRWEKIASKVEGKSVDEIKHHYELLVDDVSRIESGHVPLPCYSSSSADGSISDEANTKGGNLGSDSKGLKYEQERRKGIAWTEEEHKNFLLGLEEYGKGDWRSISRNSVVTRTPTQVASHAQKYFIRLNSMNKDRRRSSIHDITSVNGGDDVSVPKGPITGEINGSSSAAGSSSSKQTMGKPMIGRPHVSVVGTPAHMPYVVRGSVPGQVVSGKRMGVGPVAYHTAAHR